MSPRRCNHVVLLVVLAALLNAAAAPATQPVEAVARIGVTVSDVDRSVEFFTRVLDFHVTSDEEIAGDALERLTGVFGARCRVVRMKLGDETLELTEYLAASEPGRAVPADSRSNDRWFQHIAIVTTDLDAAYRRLRAHDVRHASTGPQVLPSWNPNAGGIGAFYFHDPDGHVLEAISFPPGKGDPRWQHAKGLFVGIDHTAIVVESTEKSLAFYRDALGMTVAGGSENYGTEQAHLNNVPGAHLRITTLKAGRGGPGVELLEYFSPRGGRPYPSDARPNDLFHWQTVFTRAGDPALARDADGHAVLYTRP